MCISGAGSHMVATRRRETLMTINLSVPQTMQELRPRITVVGVGGAGGNAVNLSLIHISEPTRPY